MKNISKGEWSVEAALSSDLHNIRYITADGRRIASVCMRNDMTQDEAISNANLLSKAKMMMETLKEVAEIAKWVKGNDCDLIVQKVYAVIGDAVQDQMGNGLLGTEGNFGFRVIRQGQTYGVNDCLVWEKAEPGIEFYILKTRRGVPYGGMGWFISRYYYTTLKFSKVTTEGLCLEGSMADTATLSGPMMSNIMATVDEEISTFANQNDVQTWRNSWKIKR